MAENLEDPVELDALQQEKSTTGEDHNLTFRRLTRKTVLEGDEISWTEEVIKSKRVRAEDSGTTIVSEQTENVEAERGKLLDLLD
jgi:hypothetical protein